MNQRYSDIETALEAAVKRMQEIAVDGLAPGMKTFNAKRGPGIPSADWFWRMGIQYSEIIQRAGLKQHPPGFSAKPAPAKPAPAKPKRTGVPRTVEAEIMAAFERGDHIDHRRKEWPMRAIPTRVETVIVPQGDGTALKITRYYASLR